jgi:inhibitor of the pro-sigma K processing machinery
MSTIEKLALGLVIAFGAMACLRLLSKPLKMVLQITCNAALGFGALWILRQSTIFTGISLGLNLFNMLIIGLLGLPGFGLLVLLQWVLT